ncbi:hypothetical protein [Streptomyces alkaliphilus]|uniref:hypothetical protein n=1 Tax=Streptomyces alkaliphilus TaxID=1472722 RepID=UPI003F661DAB
MRRGTTFTPPGSPLPAPVPPVTRTIGRPDAPDTATRSAERESEAGEAGGSMPKPGHPERPDADRSRRRAEFLRELHEAKALRERVRPRRARTARLRLQQRMRTFRW